MDSPMNRNMDLLKRRFPDVFDRVADVPIPVSHELIVTAAGAPTLRVTTAEGRQIHLHSPHDPLREAERIAAALPGEKWLLVVLGCGLFYHVLAALDTLDAGEPVLLVEADPALFRMALSCTALDGVLQRPSMVFWVGEAPESLGNFLDRHYPDDRLAKLAVLRHLPASELNPDYYRMAYEDVIRCRDRADCRVQDPPLAAFMEAHLPPGPVLFDAALSCVARSGAAPDEVRDVLHLMRALREDRD